MTEYKTVKELLADPERWIKGVSAVDESGNDVMTGSLNAACWCLYGGINEVYPWDIDDQPSFLKWRDVMKQVADVIRQTPIYPEFLDDIKESIVTDSDDSVIMFFNDHPETSHADVVGIVEKAGI